MRRVFDVCHGCRLCFSQCESFPKLFELIDASPTGELDTVPSTDFKKVVDECTLCDMCFLSKCPYVPPHELNIDFPHLMLRYRAVENMKVNTNGITLEKPLKDSVEETTGSKLSTEKISAAKGVSRELELKPEEKLHSLYTDTDLVGKLATRFSSAVNYVTRTDESNKARELMQTHMNIHTEADLPKYVSSSHTFLKRSKEVKVVPNSNAKAFNKKRVVLYATCLVNYNKPEIGHATRAVLAHNGVEVRVEYERCCGMPQLESGKVKDVAERANETAKHLSKLIDEGYDVVTSVASCTLMLKNEWPALSPDNPDVMKLSKNTYDISEYIIKLAKEEGLESDLQPIEGTVTIHQACHSRAQAIGFKSREMLKKNPKN
eukprot:TRINITY_DN4259_c0_g1_i3.p1 TRINITY_DN4259_c0_g1~~TRINITY_DN4259_c0_g1_i3.p1  ORF type:complete len:376 (-),score=68.28 TRINITY_DN4259_c0_g1_i3:159-1286(-)